MRKNIGVDKRKYVEDLRAVAEKAAEGENVREQTGLQGYIVDQRDQLWI